MRDLQVQRLLQLHVLQKTKPLFLLLSDLNMERRRFSTNVNEVVTDIKCNDLVTTLCRVNSIRGTQNINTVDSLVNLWSQNVHTYFFYGHAASNRPKQTQTICEGKGEQAYAGLSYRFESFLTRSITLCTAEGNR